MTRSQSHKKPRRYVPISETDKATGPHVALVPGEDAPLIRLTLPDGLRGAAREQVARRQTADMLGLAADVLDIRPFNSQDAGLWSRVLVTTPNQIGEWSRRAADTACSEILPDYLSLPAGGDVWVISLQSDRLLARLGPEDGFSGELQLARPQLALALQANPPRAVLWQGSQDAEILTMFATAEIPVLQKPSELAAMGLDEPVQLATGGVNLRELAGAVQARRRARLARWRMPLVLAVLALGFWISAQWIAISRNDDFSRATRAATTTIVRQVFVPAGPILDIRTQVSRKTAGLMQRGDERSATLSPVTLLRRAAASLSGSGVRLQSASHRTGAGVELFVKVADFAALDRLAEALRASQLDVEMTSAASDEEGGVVGQIQISEPS